MACLSKPISIGDSVTLADNVILAPMSGVSDYPFRKLVKRFGASLVVSEMIASRAMIMETKQSMQKIKKEQDHFPMAVQLAGCEEETMAEAAKLNEDMGADIIDINYGCPVKKVVNGFAGSAMMKDEVKAKKLLEAVVKAVKIPVTLKMRMGWDANHLNAPKIAKDAEEVGIQMITIHGRTRCQLYKGKANWDFIKKVKDVVSIPVIANGDITSLQACEEALGKSTADGIMIGRGCYGKPWFINQASQYLQGQTTPKPPSIQQQKEILLEHFEDMLEFYGKEAGIRMARKHIGWYSAGLQDSASFRNKVMRSLDANHIKQEVKDFYQTLT